jgi:hypothetical protein
VESCDKVLHGGNIVHAVTEENNAEEIFRSGFA